ncbi:MAG: DUF547 domain-containing protein [Saprospiraceae bacterium]|nr:DUF547 domain-containing protein [Saprospiraceae bacterium]MBK7738211.1 DUF547 domain-containing protein [Saprospiraceae bacterium]MBK7913214.1 DUF547 domain-containing protein [Saprospiraceae bacterium]
MRFFIILIGLSCWLKCDSQALSHNRWSELLKLHVDSSGNVNYKSIMKDSIQLNNYLAKLSNNPPRPSWTVNETKAYWINAYNAFTIQLVLRNYPIRSIKEIGSRIPFINSTWDIPFIRIGSELLSLNTIEHLILRKKYKDPRIHMALVCASRSCPALKNEAYSAESLDFQLDEQSYKFIMDPFRNKIQTSDLKISQLFKWYSSDFKKGGGIIPFINKYSEVKIQKNAQIDYLEYDWSLNEKTTPD